MPAEPGRVGEQKGRRIRIKNDRCDRYRQASRSRARHRPGARSECGGGDLSNSPRSTRILLPLVRLSGIAESSLLQALNPREDCFPRWV
jgi:hypothetical protein